jgi:hypothetical protein
MLEFRLLQVILAPEALKADNELLLRFSPAEDVAKSLEKEHGKVRNDCTSRSDADSAFKFSMALGPSGIMQSR